MIDYKKLLIQVAIKFGLSIIILGLILFLPAGTLNYTNGWILIISLLILMSIALSYLLAKDPELLEKRMRLREKQQEQKAILKISWILFFIAFIIPGLDYRFGWSQVPLWLVVLAVFIMSMGYIMFIEVMRENSYASRIIEVQENQHVIDSGLYGIIRHPMYAAALIIYIAMPMVLGSYFAYIPLAFFPVVIVLRIMNEEKLLARELPGYTEYMKKVKYRLIPFIW